MKKIMLLIACIVVPLATNAQSFFDTLEDMDGVNVVVVTKDAFELISKFKNEKIKDNEGMRVFQMIQDLNEFKMFSTKDATIADKMRAMVKTGIKKENLTELMRVKDDDSNVKIYVKSTKNKDFVSEVLMFIRGVSKKNKHHLDSMIISLSGNIDINKM
ncbi:MAG: DUF4252 domain-containing protein, partial [Polaribacter sp.]